jgi:hypothetical protein
MQLNPQVIATIVAFNNREAERALFDLTHAQSVRQLPFEANCLNWLMGHLTVYRDRMLRLVGGDPLWNAEQTARYDYGSPPVLDPTDCLPYEQIVADWQTAGVRLLDCLAVMPPETLLAPHDKTQTKADRLVRYAWHEGYHIGQCDILRAYVTT